MIDDLISPSLAIMPTEGEYVALRVADSGAVWVDFACRLPAETNNIVTAVAIGTGGVMVPGLWT